MSAAVLLGLSSLFLVKTQISLQHLQKKNQLISDEIQQTQIDYQLSRLIDRYSVSKSNSLESDFISCIIESCDTFQ